MAPRLFDKAPQKPSAPQTNSYVRGRNKPADMAVFQSMSPNTYVPGTMVEVREFMGAFVDVTLTGGEHVVGLLPISKMRDEGLRIKNATEELYVGQKVDVRVIEVDFTKGDVIFSGCPNSNDPVVVPSADLSAFEGISSDQWLTGKVAKVAQFGTFVRVTAPNGKATVNGLVHSSQIKDSLVGSVKKELEPDQAVQVRIQALDVMGGTMSLTMKSKAG